MFLFYDEKMKERLNPAEETPECITENKSSR